jgi:hypothetical protein
MESQTPEADEHVSSKRNNKDRVMIVLEAIPQATDCKVDEEGVREGIDDLGGIRGSIVVLHLSGPSVRSNRLFLVLTTSHQSIVLA